MIIALTGHRPNKLGNEYNMNGPYSEAIKLWIIEQLRNYKPEKVISGMALGADMILVKAL